MTYDAKRVGRAIEAARQRVGISTNAWAQEAGLSEGTIRAIVNGTTASTRLETIYRMAAAIDVPVWELLGEEQPWKKEAEMLKAALDGSRQLVVQHLEMLDAALARMSSLPDCASRRVAD